jgi:ketosteroid isomerase-like protein
MAQCTEPGEAITAFGAAFSAADADAPADLYEDDATFYDIGGPELA